MNVGDYVRTKDGLIGKYNIKKEYHTIPMWQGGSKCQEVEQQYINNIKYNRFDYEIIKSSPQIIDLIEVGDYVNGDYVTKEVPKDKRKKQIIIVDSTCVECGSLPLNNDDIKTIVTHEQMEAMQYRVEE